MSESSPIKDVLDILAVAGACVTFAWGVWTWKKDKEQERAATETDSVRHAESRRIEATRPYLEMQLRLYAETVSVTSKLATRAEPTAEARFWELYYGELALVENRDVEQAMITFGDALHRNAREELPDLALVLRRYMRESLAKSWGAEAWRMETSARQAS